MLVPVSVHGAVSMRMLMSVIVLGMMGLVFRTHVRVINGAVMWVRMHDGSFLSGKMHVLEGIRRLQTRMGSKCGHRESGQVQSRARCLSEDEHYTIFIKCFLGGGTVGSVLFASLQ
jgi:hypothetical protein